MKNPIMFVLLGVSLLTVSASQFVFAQDDPYKLVQDTTKTILTKLKQEKDVIKKRPERVAELVNEIVFTHFDFGRMSSKVLGKHWESASEAQKKKFTEQFSLLLVRTYSKALQDNVDQEIKFIPGNLKSGASKVTVKTEIPQESGFPIPINYKLSNKSGSWKVYDVVIDAVSLVTNYRSSFKNQIKKAGLDSLIASLQDRNTGKSSAN